MSEAKCLADHGQAPGRSRGGFGTKIHGIFDGLGHPVWLLLTATNVSVIGQAEALLADHEPEAVIADKGYVKKALVEAIEARGAAAVILTQKNRKEQREIDAHRFTERNLCERFWSKAKPYRRVATRLRQGRRPDDHAQLTGHRRLAASCPFDLNRLPFSRGAADGVDRKNWRGRPANVSYNWPH